MSKTNMHKAYTHRVATNIGIFHLVKLSHLCFPLTSICYSHIELLRTVILNLKYNIIMFYIVVRKCVNVIHFSGTYKQYTAKSIRRYIIILLNGLFTWVDVTLNVKRPHKFLRTVRTFLETDSCT